MIQITPNKYTNLDVYFLQNQSLQKNSVIKKYGKENSRFSEPFNSSSVAFKGLGNFFRKTPKPDFKNLFEEIKYVQAKIWDGGHLIINPEVEKYIKIFENLSTASKRKFVKEFCNQTGFPDLKKVKEVMDSEIVNVTERLCSNAGYKPLFIGYSSSCSLGRAVAIPGSDCDGLFVVVDKKIDYNKINRGMLGNSINQRLLETTGKHYPEIFSINQLMRYIEMSDCIFDRIKTPQKIKIYEKNLERTDQDFIKAGTFNIDLASKITRSKDRNMMYLTAFFVEELRNGNILVNNIDKHTLNRIKSSAMYKYSNVVRQEGFKNNIKPKWTNRKVICKNFDKMNTEQQFDICLDIFKRSLGIKQQNKNSCYVDFNMGNIEESIKMLTSFPSV